MYLKKLKQICMVAISIYLIGVSKILGQSLSVNNVTVNSGTRLYSHYNSIVSPSDGSTVLMTGTSQVDYKAGTKINLKSGFRAGAYTGGGKFKAYLQTDFEVTTLVPSSGNVGKLEKFEVGLKLPSTILNQITNGTINPYDPEQISVEATFTSPTGVNKLIYGFYYKDYTYATNGSGVLTDWIEQATNYAWRVRFAPDELGTWTYSIKVVSPLFATMDVSGKTFICDPSGNKGYLQRGNDNYHLRYSENHETFFAIGQDIAWPVNKTNPPEPETQTFKNRRDHIQNLADNSGNYFRVVLAPWGEAVEWSVLGNYTNRQRYHWELDKIFEVAHSNNQYIHLCMEMHTAYSTGSNHNEDWTVNVYRQPPVGITSPMEFFSNVNAKKYYKRRIRYMMARWGYSTNLAVWELFSEVDQVYGYKTDIASSTTWHDEMASYIKNTLGDTKHMVSSSYADEYTDDGVYGNPLIDLTSKHVYGIDPQGLINIKRFNELVAVNNYNDAIAPLQGYGKPYILGEMGANNDIVDQCTYDEMHCAVWATSFTNSFGCGLYWWQWHNNAYRAAVFPTLKSFINGINFETNYFRPFKGQGSRKTIESFSLVNANRDFIVGWMHNRSYYWYEDPSAYPCGLINPRSVDGKEELVIPYLRIGTTYNIEWYRTANAGPVTLYGNTYKKVGLLGKLKPRVFDQFLYVGEYGYKVYVSSAKTQSITLDNDTIPCVSDSLYFNGIYGDDLTGTQYSYSWNFGNGASSTLWHPKIKYAVPGNYTVSLTVTKSGFTETLVQNFTILNDCAISKINDNSGDVPANTEGIINQSKSIEAIKIYPNPNNGYFQVGCPAGQNIDNRILIYDVLGKIVEEIHMTTDHIEVNLSEQKKGVYYVKIMNSNGIKIEKIVYQ